MTIHRKYFGFKVSQRRNGNAASFFVFAVLAKDVAAWATVDRVEHREGGVQRRVSEARLRALTRFFTLEPKNTIPTSIVLAFTPGTATFEKVPVPEVDIGLQAEQHYDNELEGIVEYGFLAFDFDPEAAIVDRPAFVVDGQHRLFGTADVDEEIPLLVSALLEAGPDEQAFQFIVINNKVIRVSTDIVRTLIVDFDEQSLQKRLETARISLAPQALEVALVDDEADSPLYQMVDWERRRGEGNPAVKPVAIEESLKYIRRRFAELEEDQDGRLGT